MELETNTSVASPDISDEVRLSASTKRVTLSPLHQNVEPERVTDAFDADQHTPSDLPVAIPGDQESTYSPPSAPTTIAKPVPESPARTKSPLLIAGIGLACTTAIIVGILILR